MDYVQGGARKFQYFTNTGFSSRYEVLDFFLPGIIDRFIVFSISIPHDRFTSHARESESVRPAGSRFFESVFFLIKTIGYETRHIVVSICKHKCIYILHELQIVRSFFFNLIIVYDFDFIRIKSVNFKTGLCKV